MISPEQMTKAVFILDAARLITATQGQSIVWHDIVTGEVPMADVDDLMAAVRRLTTRDPSAGSMWMTVNHLIAELKSERRKRIEAEERKQRQIESGQGTVSPIDIKSLMRDAREGMSPEEIGRRARERAEGKGDDEATGGAK